MAETKEKIVNDNCPHLVLPSSPQVFVAIEINLKPTSPRNGTIRRKVTSAYLHACTAREWTKRRTKGNYCQSVISLKSCSACEDQRYTVKLFAVSHNDRVIDFAKSKRYFLREIMVSERCTRCRVHTDLIPDNVLNTRKGWTFYIVLHDVCDYRPIENEFPMNCRGSRIYVYAYTYIYKRCVRVMTFQDGEKKKSMDNTRNW